MNSIHEMEKCIECLRLELPEPVMNDVVALWNAVLEEIEWVKEIERRAIEQSEYIQLHGLSFYEKIGMEGKIRKQDKEIERLRKRIKELENTITDMQYDLTMDEYDLSMDEEE